MPYRDPSTEEMLRRELECARRELESGRRELARLRSREPPLPRSRTMALAILLAAGVLGATIEYVHSQSQYALSLAVLCLSWLMGMWCSWVDRCIS